MKKFPTRKIAFTAICAALATVSFVIENLFPPLIIPGARMGVSNIFILLCAFTMGGVYGFICLVVKITLGSLFSGNISMMMYSLPAGVLALSIELILIYLCKKISVVAISTCGSIINITVQNAVFCLITKTTEYFCYLPYLAIIGAVSGVLVGLVVYLIIKRLNFAYFLK